MKALGFFSLYCTLLTSLANAQYFPDVISESTSPAHYYYPNQGQLADDNGNLVPSIEYATVHANPSLFFAKDSIRFQYLFVDSLNDTNVFCLNMKFVCNPEITCEKSLSAEHQKSSKVNFFYDHCPTGVTGVQGYEEVKYTNAFPDIDIRFFSNGLGPKAYFVLNPNANPSNLVIEFEGQDSIEIDTAGMLTIYKMGLGYEFPYASAYQIDNLNNTTPLNWHPNWVDNGNGTVSVTMGIYDPLKTLVLRLAGVPPNIQSNSDNLNWSTFWGSSGFERAVDIENEDGVSDYFYVLSDAEQSKEFYKNSGINKYAGSIDVHISQFDGDRDAEWETFWGSKSNEEAVDMEYSSNNEELYITGRYIEKSGSDIIFPTVNNGVYKQIDAMSNHDTWLMSIDKLGSPKWVSYFGGTDDDIVTALDIDDELDELYIVGYTKSSTTISSCNAPTSSNKRLSNVRSSES